MKEELRDLYFSRAQMTFRKDPHAKEALELAKKALANDPTDAQALDYMKRKGSK